MNIPTSETPKTTAPITPIPERIGIDIDGVLANFTYPVAALASEMFDVEVSGHATGWNWMRDHGIVDDKEATLWAWLKDHPEWWGFLPPMEYARMALAHLRESSAEVYFMTARPGFGIKSVTENWLRFHGFPDPTVLIVSNKAPIVDALKIDVFVDDKPETCADVVATTNARVFMPDRPWNQGVEISGVTRVASLIEALQRVGIARIP